MSEPIAAPVPGTPEYDAAMIAKVDASAAASAAAAGESGLPGPQRPENVPEEFWDAEKGVVNTEALLAAYNGKAAPATGDSDPATVDDAKAAAEAAGVDYSAIQSEYDADGALSDATYAKLAASGFDRAVVDSFIAGQEALASEMVSNVHKAVGGEDRFAAMTDWAKVNMSPAEIAAFNRGVGGDPEDALLAVQGLQARYEQANGKQPQLLGGTPPSGVGAGYASRAEMTADIRNPQYDKDPAFRAKVQSRIAASTAF